MILVLSGTREGREVTSLLVKHGYEVLSLTTSLYGKEQESEKVKQLVVSGTDKEQLLPLFDQGNITGVVDVTHPFSGAISENIRSICLDSGVVYLRYLREETILPEHPLIHPVYSWEEAAKIAAQMGNTIFLTTGSYNLENFMTVEGVQNKRIVIRVFPDYNILKKCQDLGIPPKDIVAMQGPFSKEMNKVMFKTFKASVVITKDSGKTGGTDTKIAAALSLGIPVIVIKRPLTCGPDGVSSYEEILARLKTLEKLVAK